MRNRHFYKCCLTMVVTATLLISLPTANAVDWTLNNNGTWETNANPPWDGGVFPNGVGAVADFSTIDITNHRNVSINGSITVGSMAFGDTSGTHQYRLNDAGGTTGVITFDASSGNALITKTSGGNDTLNVNKVLADSLDINNTSSNRLIFRGDVTGSGGINVNNGYFELRGSVNTYAYTGTTTINNGSTLLYDDVGAGDGIGSGNLTITDGVLENYWADTFSRSLGTGNNQFQITGGTSGFSGQGAQGMTVRVGNNANNEVVWGSTFFNPTTLVLQSPTANSNGKLNFNNRLDLNGATRTIAVNKDNDAAGGWALISGVIRDGTGGNAGLIKTGPGVLRLNAANTFTGGIAINDGVIRAEHSDALGDGGPISFGNAAAKLDLRASPTIGALSSAAGNGTITIGNTSSQTLTVNQSTNTSYGGIIEDGTGTLQLVKSGGGTLTLTGNNDYSGGTVLNGGQLNISSDANLGTAGAGITFDASATLRPEVSVTSARPIMLNNSATATFLIGTSNNNTTFANSGAVTGDGGIVVNKAGNGNNKFVEFSSLSNTFTGPIRLVNLGGSTRVKLTLNSLADSASNIIFDTSSGTTTFEYGAGAAGPLTLNNRQFELVDGNARGIILNSHTSAMTINTDLVVTGTGTKSLGLTSSPGGTFAGDINEGASTLNLSITGPWTFTGNNDYSGLATLTSGASLSLQGAQAISPNASYEMFKNTTLEILTDDAGTVTGASGIQLRRNDTSTGIVQNYTIRVDNNGGGTTGTVVDVGNVDYSQGDRRPPRQLNFEGGNGYSVQVGDVILDTEMISTASGASGGNQRLRGNSAAVDITGTVKQLNGNTGTQTNSHNFFLGGTNTNNVVSGVIADADDFTDNSNPNARALNIFKGESGTWTFTGVNTYTGDTTILDGTLEIGGAGQLGSGNYAGNVEIGDGDTFIVNSSADQTISGLISDTSGNGTLIKNNTGTLLLSGANSYGGPTNVLDGTLIIDGTTTGQGDYNVASGARLGGNGNIGANVNIAGTPGDISPGSGGTGYVVPTPPVGYTGSPFDATYTAGTDAATVGQTTISGNLNLDGNFLVDIFDASTVDSLLVTGTTTLDNAGFDPMIEINGETDLTQLDFGALGLIDSTITLIESAAFVGEFENALLDQEITDADDNTVVFSLDGNNLVLSVSSSTVPEPASLVLWALIGLGLGGFGYCRRRRKK